MAQTVQGNLDRPKGSENLVCHRRPQNSFSNLFWDTILVDEQFTWERVLDLVVYHQSNHVRCAPVHKHWPGRISAILYLNIEAVIRFNNTVGIVSKHNGLIYAFNVQKKIIWKKKFMKKWSWNFCNFTDVITCNLQLSLRRLREI